MTINDGSWIKIYDEYSTGKSMLQLSKEIGYSNVYISNMFKRLGFKKRTQAEAIKLSMTPTRIKQMSESNKGQEPWNKGLTKYTNSSINKYSKDRMGVQHWNWKGGRRKDGQGRYWLSQNGVRKLEHQVNWMNANGFWYIPAGMHIHHVDRNKQNNDPNNLVMLPKAIHCSLHAKLRILENEDNKYFGKNQHLRGTI